MTNRTKYCLIGAAFVLLAMLLIVASSAHGQDQQNVPLYKITDLSSAGGWGIYKTVYQGCELFIAIGNPYSSGTAVSITTGRGCK